MFELLLTSGSLEGSGIDKEVRGDHGLTAQSLLSDGNADTGRQHGWGQKNVLATMKEGPQKFAPFENGGGGSSTLSYLVGTIWIANSFTPIIFPL